MDCKRELLKGEKVYRRMRRVLCQDCNNQLNAEIMENEIYELYCAKVYKTDPERFYREGL